MSVVYFITHPDVLIDPAVPVPEWPLSPRGRARMQAASEEGCSFLKKKNQKTFIHWAGASREGPARMDEVFLLLFLQKKKILSF